MSLDYLSLTTDKRSNTIVPIALYGSETFGKRSVERRRVNVLEMKYLRSSAGVTHIDKVKNEEVCRKAEVERELAGRKEQGMLQWFGHVGRTDEYCIVRRLLLEELSGMLVECLTEITLSHTTSNATCYWQPTRPFGAKSITGFTALLEH